MSIVDAASTRQDERTEDLLLTLILSQQQIDVLDHRSGGERCARGMVAFFLTRASIRDFRRWELSDEGEEFRIQGIGNHWDAWNPVTQTCMTAKMILYWRYSVVILSDLQQAHSSSVNRFSEPAAPSCETRMTSDAGDG